MGACTPEPQKPGAQLTSEDVKAMSQREQQAGHDESAKMLSDGVIDKADYDQAFTNLEQCMTGLGYTVTDPVVSPADGLSLLFGYVNPGRAPEKLDSDSLECETKFWAAVTTVYTNTNEQTTEEAVRVAAIDCLNAKGFKVPAEARNYKAMSGDPTADGGAQRKEAEMCVIDNVYKLHPDIHSVGLSN